MSACQWITEQTRQEKGCLGCRLCQDMDNENLIHLEETWEHRSYMEEHFRSDIFIALLGGVKLLGESYEIRINKDSEMDGMEAV